jgi:hypothetical protein
MRLLLLILRVAIRSPERFEWLAGKLIVASARARLRRGAPGDAHEIRHLHAALVAGNTAGEDVCSLDFHEPDESWSYIDHLARLREQGIL